MESVGQRQPTTGCRHGSANLVRNADDAWYFWCDECSTRVTKAVTGHNGWALPHDHPSCAHLTTRDIPLHQFGTHRVCEHCGKTAQCEAHHIAPRALFADAESWPLVYLCRPCHAVWHDVVTPYLPGHTNPTRLADVLLRWLSADEMTALSRAIRDKRKAA